jgi:hypothetical protein
MSESANMQRINLERSLFYITQQEIPVPSTNPIYMFFIQRKASAINYYDETFSRMGKEELLDYVEYCNEQIKKYLLL